MLVYTFLTTLILPLAYCFSFSTSTADLTQCGVVDITWSGGSPPFSLLVLPAFDYPTNTTLPDSAWDAQTRTGRYSWTVNYPSSTDLVMLMSDATGTGTGGVSPLYTVGSSSNSSACSLRSTSTDFYFYLNATSVNSCDPVEVYWDDTATNPVTILGAIPGGQPFQIASTGTSQSLVWLTNIAAGSQFILAAFDQGQVGTGGSSALLTVGSGSSGCLNDLSPSSTPVRSPTASETGSPTGGGVKTVTAITTATPKGSAGLSTGAIVGIAVGAIVAVLILQGILFYFCCRRQLRALLSHRRQMREHEVKEGDVDLMDDPEREAQDRATSLHAVRTGETSNRLSMAGFGNRTRSSIGDTFDGESSVSPFWEPAATSPIRGPFDSPPDEDLMPPQRAHLRNDSLSSTNSRPLTLNLDGSPSTHSLLAFSPSAPLMPAVPGPSYPRNPAQSKAQMANSLAAQNPDRDPLTGFNNRQPPAEAPAGGFRFHQDAGRLNDEAREATPPAPEVEDLPPMYNAQWETESAGRRGSEATQGDSFPSSPVRRSSDDPALPEGARR